jgi:hypothetical protein
MPKFVPVLNNSSNATLPVPGRLIFTKDGEVFVDTDSGRLDYNDFVSKLDLAALNALLKKRKNVLYCDESTNLLYRWDGTKFVRLGNDFVSKQDLAALGALLEKKQDVLYCAEDTNLLYRWDGAMFVRLGGNGDEKPSLRFWVGTSDEEPGNLETGTIIVIYE